MHLSPPITVLPILAVGLAGTVSLAPPPNKPSRATVTLSTATYQKLALWAKEHTGADGRPLTVVQVIEEFAKSQE